MKKTIIAAALVLSLAVVACDNGDEPTAEPIAEPTSAAEVVETMAAETMAPEPTAAPEADESMAAEAVESPAS